MVIIDDVNIRQCKTEEYVEVHMRYLMEQLDWLKKNTTLRPEHGGSPTVRMLDNLLTWMATRKKPIWKIFTDEKKWKQWIALREDHWLVDLSRRDSSIRKKLI